MLLISIISIIIYIVAGVMIYHNLYNYDKSSKIKLMAIGFIITFIITVIICFISASGINASANYVSIARNSSILIFAPINAVISLPYICNMFNKYKEKRINETQLKRKILIFSIILIFIVIFEMSYIKDFEIGLINNASIKQ